MTSRSVRLAALAAAFLPTVLQAQTCDLKNHYRIVNSVNNVPASELRIDTGWQTVGPLLSPGSNYNSNPQGCYSQGNCNPISDFGYLHVDGTGSASTCSAGGVFLWLDEWIGAEPKAQFRDRLLVTSATLPVGTPVQVQWTLAFGGFVSMTNANSYLHKRAQLSCSGTVIDTQATGTFTAVANTTVGASLQVSGRLWATLQDYQLLQGQPWTGSYAVDLTATFRVSNLTAGVTLVACSASTYDGLTARALPVGFGCGAVPPSLVGSAPVLGGSSQLGVTGAPAGAPVVLAVAGGDAIWAQIGPCTLQVDPNAMIVLDVVGLADGTGSLSHALAIPFVAAFAGTTVTAQALPLLTNGPFLGLGELSNGLELHLGY
jgi:hypothetical protein